MGFSPKCSFFFFSCSARLWDYPVLGIEDANGEGNTIGLGLEPRASRVSAFQCSWPLRMNYLDGLFMN